MKLLSFSRCKMSRFSQTEVKHGKFAQIECWKLNYIKELTTSNTSHLIEITQFCRN